MCQYDVVVAVAVTCFAVSVSVGETVMVSKAVDCAWAVIASGHSGSQLWPGELSELGCDSGNMLMTGVIPPMKLEGRVVGGICTVVDDIDRDAMIVVKDLISTVY